MCKRGTLSKKKERKRKREREIETISQYYMVKKEILSVSVCVWERESLRRERWVCVGHVHVLLKSASYNTISTCQLWLGIKRNLVLKIINLNCISQNDRSVCFIRLAKLFKGDIRLGKQTCSMAITVSREAKSWPFKKVAKLA